MKSRSRGIMDSVGLIPRKDLHYPVLLASVIGNAILLLPLFLGSAPVRPYFALLAVLVVVPPAVMGYTDQPFSLGVGLGVLPAFVMAVVDNPLRATYVDNMIKLGIVWGGLILPVATVLFVVGVLIRERTSSSDRMRNIAWRTLLAFVLSATILLLRTRTGLLDTGVLH